MTEMSTLTSKGQVTVPKGVRERLGLKSGDKLSFTVLSNGTLVVRAKTGRVADLAGMLTPSPPVHVPIGAMNPVEIR